MPPSDGIFEAGSSLKAVGSPKSSVTQRAGAQETTLLVIEFGEFSQPMYEQKSFP